MNWRAYVLTAAGLTVGLLGLAGCRSESATIIDGNKEDIDAEVQGWGLRKLSPGEYPDMRVAFADRAGLEQAINKSLQFLAKPSTVKFYPSMPPEDTITHAQVKATLEDMLTMLHSNMTPDQFQQQILARYDVYTSKGYNDRGSVWFTGYYTPIYYGSPVPTAEFKYPVYKRPADLNTDPLTGEVIGGTYPSREELMQSGRLRGLELMYFRTPIEPFIIQVQGSAKVVQTNGQVVYLGYAGSNGQEHRGLGGELVKDGKIDKRHLSLPAVLAYFNQHPNELDAYVMRDKRFTFMKIYDQTEWPAGSLGVQVTPNRTLATDKKLFPRASLCFVSVDKPSPTGTGTVPYQGFVLDQDAGGGIKKAGRADLYMGIGDEAGQMAGHQYAEGRLYYLFLKPTAVGPTGGPNPVLAPAPAAAPGRSPADAEMFPGATRR